MFIQQSLPLPLSLPLSRKPINKLIMMNVHQSSGNNDIIKKELRALNVGLSLNIMTKIATDIRYGTNIVDFKLFIIELLLGYYTYGIDRYKDDESSDYRIYIYDIIYIIIISLISNNTIDRIPFNMLIYLTKYYKDVKIYLGVYKSLYIGTMWTISIIILPSIIHDNNLNILKEPLNYIPYVLCLLSVSNTKDIEDVEKDKQNNIQTIPVKFGTEMAKKISINCLKLFIILISFNIYNHYLLIS